MQPNRKPGPVVAVDLGGTKIVAALVSSRGEIEFKEYLPTLAGEGVEVVISRIFAAIDRVLSTSGVKPAQLAGIGIAAAGVLDLDRGVVSVSPNLPGWHDIPLREMVREKLGRSIFLINDTSAAAWGEHCYGRGRGVDNLIFLAIGTGIGGGIIIDGRLYHGVNGSAGEIGHMTIDVNGPQCSCGNIGCLEMLASGTAIAKEAMARIAQGAKSSLAGLAPEGITAERVSVAAQRGDPLALEVISRAGGYLGVGMVNLVNLFNPELIVVGGGVAGMGDMLLNPARQVVKERAFELPARGVRIVPSPLGNDAGVLGAAALVLQKEAE
jgi:glucokinase